LVAHSTFGKAQEGNQVIVVGRHELGAVDDRADVERDVCHQVSQLLAPDTCGLEPLTNTVNDLLHEERLIFLVVAVSILVNDLHRHLPRSLTELSQPAPGVTK